MTAKAPHSAEHAREAERRPMHARELLKKVSGRSTD